MKLLHELHQHGVRGNALSWLKAFLTGALKQLYWRVKAHQKFLSTLESPKVLCLALYCFYYILTTYRRTYTHRSDFLQMTRQSILLSIITPTPIPFSKTLTPYKHGNACGTWILIRVSVKCYTFPNPSIQLSTYTCYMDRYLKPWTTPST